MPQQDDGTLQAALLMLRSALDIVDRFEQTMAGIYLSQAIELLESAVDRT